MIRSFKSQDLNKVMKLWLDTNIMAHSFIGEEYWKSNYDAVKSMMPSANIYIYEENNCIQGFIGLMDTYIAGIFVNQDFQSKGIGKKLLNYAKNKNEVLSLNVYKENIRAVKFYLREDFDISNEQVDVNTGKSELHMNWKKRV